MLDPRMDKCSGKRHSKSLADKEVEGSMCLETKIVTQLTIKNQDIIFVFKTFNITGKWVDIFGDGPISMEFGSSQNLTKIGYRLSRVLTISRVLILLEIDQDQGKNNKVENRPISGILTESGGDQGRKY
ncbi:unnamed protein product [Arabidopsis thaliana]|uniref:Uncharacterized protein n=1 Tax=Arabidopsis thaliana TaxID=3702 RepID=Q9LIJ6_ARATH|nr:unnamed protein product [Arabidopsis thaliana]